MPTSHKPPAPRLAALAPVREMMTPALGMLLLFQVLSGVLVAPLFSLFPVYVEAELHLKSSFTGNLRGLFAVQGGLVALFGGIVVDALGRKPAYLLAMTGVLASGGLFLARSPAALVLLALFAGLMFGLGAVAGQSYLMDSVGRHSLGLATACYFMTGTVGNAVGNLVAGRLVRGPSGYGALGVGMVAGEALLMLAAIRLMPALPRPETPRGVSGIMGGYRELLGQPAIRLLLLLRFFPTVYWGGVTLLIPLLLFRLTGRASPASDYTAASLVLSALCQVMAGRLVDRIGPRRPVLGAVCLVTLAALAKGLLAHQLWGVVLFGMVGAGAAWSLSVTMTTLIQELSTEETKARLLGITHMAWSAGFVAGNVATGFLAQQPGREGLAFFAGAGCCLAAALCAVGVVSRLPRPEP